MKQKIIIIILILTALIGISATALELQYAGTISNNLFAPSSLALSDDNLAVLEPFSKQLKLFTPDGIISHQINITGETKGLSRVSQDVYIFCDLSSKKITAVDINTDQEYDFFEGFATFSDPTDIIVSQNNLYVLDAGDNQIIKFDESKIEQNRFNLSDGTGESVKYAGSFSYNPILKRFYVLDQLETKIWVFDNSGKFIKTFGSFGAGDGEITRSGEIISSPGGYVFVSDRYQNRIAVFDQWGAFLDNIDILDSVKAEFNIPTGLAYDNNGLLYVSSTEGKKIDIFHIGSSAVSEMVTTSQSYPNNFDTVKFDDITLAALADATIGSREISGFDFELYLDSDFNQPVMNVDNLQAQLEIDSVLGVKSYISEWTLETELAQDRNYQWRTRVQFSDQSNGDWTDYRLFTTSSLPQTFHLRQNYPNPFNPETKIVFSIPTDSRVTLEVINMLGQLTKTLIDSRLPAGEHEVIWDGRDDSGQRAATGVYFYRLIAGEKSSTKKMVLLK